MALIEFADMSEWQRKHTYDKNNMRLVRVVYVRWRWYKMHFTDRIRIQQPYG